MAVKFDVDTIRGRPPSSIVAAFDFDGTISTGDSLRRFLLFALGRQRFLSAVLEASPWLLLCGARLVGRDAAKERLLRSSIAGRSCAEMEQWARRFIDHELPAMLRPQMLERVAWHQRQGHRTVLISASPGLYLRPWAQSRGFDAALCTELEIINQRYTGRLSTRNCWGSEKTRRLTAWWGKQAPATLYAYGDSAGDRQLLAQADMAWYRGVERPPRKKREP